MSAIGTAAELAVPQLALARRGFALAWKLGPWIAIAVLALALQATRATLATVRLQAKADVALAGRMAAEDRADAAERWGKAADAYATRAAALRPIVTRSNEDTDRYAQTDAGRVRCRGADRVHGIDQLDASLFTPAAPADGGAGAVPADGPAPSAGR